MVFNHRYTAYAKAHGRTPEKQLVHDRETDPSLPMSLYSLWIDAKLTEWKLMTGRKLISKDDNALFDVFLGITGDPPNKSLRAP